MDVGRFISFIRVKVKSEWTDSQYRWHVYKLTILGLMSNCFVLRSGKAGILFRGTQLIHLETW